MSIPENKTNKTNLSKLEIEGNILTLTKDIYKYFTVNMIPNLEKQVGFPRKIKSKARMLFLLPIHHAGNLNYGNKAYKVHGRYTDWEGRNVFLYR